LLVGLSGFAAGFFGPIAFLPDSNIAPVIGIFFTGPGGVVLGLALALLSNLLGLEALRRWQLLSGSVVAIALAVLAWCISAPAPKLHGRVIDATIAACHPADDMAAESIAYWEKRMASVNGTMPRAGWKEDVPRMLAADAGVVLEMRVSRQNAIYEQRKIWNRGELRASAWQAPEKPVQRYYARHAGSSCEGYPVGQSAQFLPVDEGAALARREWPPANAPNFLDLMLLKPVPEIVQKLL
jgi:hypothetical protein